MDTGPVRGADKLLPPSCNGPGRGGPACGLVSGPTPPGRAGRTSWSTVKQGYWLGYTAVGDGSVSTGDPVPGPTNDPTREPE